MHQLELEAPLSPVRVQRAYRRMVKRWHPDQFAHEPAIHALAEERLKAINQAYAILKAYSKNQPAVRINTPDNLDPIKRNPPAPLRPMSQTASNQLRQFGPREQSDNASRKTQELSGFAPLRGYQRSTSSMPSSPFERILRDISQSNIPAAKHRRAGARPLSRLRPRGRRRNGLRVEGFASLSALQPVRPISKIDPIEGSD